MKTILRLTSGLIALVLLVWILQQPESGSPDVRDRRSQDGFNLGQLPPAGEEQLFVVSEPVVPAVTAPVRDLPPPEVEFMLDREVNPRFNFNPLLDPNFRSFGGPDPLLATQAAAPAAMAPPSLLFNFDGNVTGTNPHDPVGDVGPNYYIQATNAGGGTLVNIINKTTGSSVTTFLLDSLGGNQCASGLGDPIVLYDQFADRWFLSEFSSSGNRLCVYVSQTNDPLGSYYAYNFQSANSFPDYPKYGVWHDAYYLGTNESSPTVYALDRNQMLSGAAATYQSFTAADLAGFGFQMITPADADGATPPPANSPNYFMRHRDDEVHNAGANNPNEDYLELFEFVVDWTTPANSSFTKVADIAVTEFDSDLCGLTSFFCFPQQGSSTTLDPLREVIMWRLQYRNFGTHEVLVANHVTDVNGSDRGGVRWYELRKLGGGSWSVYQEGTYAPGTPNRFMGSIAMDGSGNIALAYSVSDSSMFPSIWYTGREAGDPLGTMSPTEVVVYTGTGTSGSNRWGDYSSLNVDPEDDCTFWYTMEYGAGGTRRTRIASFKFTSCGTADFDLSAVPATVDICAPASAVYTTTVQAQQGFSAPVTLSASGHPAGTTAAFSVNPVTPTGTSQLTIGNTGAATAGSYSIDIVGTTTTRTHTTTVGLNLTAAVPGPITLLTPANGAANQPTQPIFTWQADAAAASYAIDIATDPGFSNIVISATGLTSPSYTPGTPLNTGTTYYWRVRGSNGCGNGAYSATFSLTTVAAPGDCGPGSIASQVYATGFESGAGGWTSSGTGNTWSLSSANPHSGSSAFHADDVSSISDQYLVSPAVALPTGESPLTLQFWNYQELEDRSGGCYDGGVLEISNDGGSNWTRLDTELLTDPYDGPIASGFGNSLAGDDAWCGDPQAYLNSIVDLDAFAGQTVNFRFRLATDSSVSRPGWDIDDVKVQSCICAAPGGVTDLGASLSGSDVVLSWTATNAVSYEIHRATMPYFTPGPATLHATTAVANYTDVAAAGDGTSYYYAIVATSSCGGAAPASNDVGEFEFSITPGT